MGESNAKTLGSFSEILAETRQGGAQEQAIRLLSFGEGADMQKESINNPDTSAARKSSTDEIVVPVVAEEINAGAERVRTGSVRVHKTVQEHDEIIDQPLLEEKAEIRRVVKNEIVEGPLPVRHSEDTTVIPVVKEVLVVQKQFVLTEEIHIRKIRSEQRHQERVVVKEEHARVERLDSRGRVVETDVAMEPTANPVRDRRTLLDNNTPSALPEPRPREARPRRT